MSRVHPGDGLCYGCGDAIEDSCGGETRRCAFCRRLETPFNWNRQARQNERFVVEITNQW